MVLLKTPESERAGACAAHVAPGHTVLPGVLHVCSLVGGMEQRTDAEERNEIRTGSQDAWVLLSASLDICEMNV